MKVNIYGPNLNRVGQDKGQMHVHEETCGDCKHYGPGTRYGGDDIPAWNLEVETATALTHEVYPPEDFDYPESETHIYMSDIYFAPCTAGLPTS